MRSCLMVMSLLTVPIVVSAQRGTPISEINAGVRVRIWADDAAPLLTARVFAPDPSGLTIQVTEGRANQVLRLSEIARIDISRGRNRVGWTAIGMLAGATAGVLVTRLGDDDGDVSGLDGLAEGFTNTFTGILVGGIVGFLAAPERWRTVWER